MRREHQPKRRPLAPRDGRAKTGKPGHGVSARLFYGVFTALVVTNIATGLALYLSPDVSALISGRQTRIVAGYEDRLAALRLEVDRLHSRQYAQAGDINLQLQELAQQQEVLTEQHQYVKALVARASALGIVPDKAGGDDAAPDPADDDSSGPGDGDTALNAALPVPGTSPDAPGIAAADLRQIEQTGHGIRKMMDESREALADITTGADDATDAILAQLRQIGITPKLPDSSADDAMGGPLLPPLPVAATSDDTAIIDTANQVATALARFRAARAAIAAAPVLKPVASTRISSPFGNRKDPFTGRLALHPGIDFPNPTGTIVHAAGAGKVIWASRMSGYGNLVEIDHGNGYISRYGHLSAYLVHVGEMVKAGEPIAKVGSTGRSTGPHLHFEVRRDDAPINPAPFLAVGRHLKPYMTAEQKRAGYSSSAAT